MCGEKIVEKSKAIITPMFSPQRYNVKVFKGDDLILEFETKIHESIYTILHDFGETNHLEITTEWSTN